MFRYRLSCAYGIIDTMNESYYKQWLRDIRTSIENNEIEKAYVQILEELSMPYIPLAFLRELQALKKELSSILKDKEQVQSTILDPQQILSALSLKDERVIQALDSMSKLNLRQHIALVEEAFRVLKDRLMISLLIRILIEQALPNEFEFNFEGTRYKIIPMSLTLPEDSDGFEIAESYLEKWCMKEPSLYQLTLQELHLQSLLLLPLVYDAHEAYDLAYEIMHKMVCALYDEQTFVAMKETFIQERSSSSTH